MCIRDRDGIVTFFGFFYVCFLISHVYLTRQYTHGNAFVWLIFFSAFGCDVGAYFTGMAFGKHKPVSYTHLVITQTANPGEEILKSSTIDIVVSSGRPAAPAVNNNSGSNSNSGSTNTSNNSSTTNNTGNSGNSGNAANNSNNASDNSTNTNTNSNNTTPQGNDVADDVPALGSMSKG